MGAFDGHEIPHGWGDRSEYFYLVKAGSMPPMAT